MSKPKIAVVFYSTYEYTNHKVAPRSRKGRRGGGAEVRLRRCPDRAEGRGRKPGGLEGPNRTAVRRCRSDRRRRGMGRRILLFRPTRFSVIAARSAPSSTRSADLVEGRSCQQDPHRDHQRQTPRRTGSDDPVALYRVMHWGAVIVAPGLQTRCCSGGRQPLWLFRDEQCVRRRGHRCRRPSGGAARRSDHQTLGLEGSSRRQRQWNRPERELRRHAIAGIDSRDVGPPKRAGVGGVRRGAKHSGEVFGRRNVRRPVSSSRLTPTSGRSRRFPRRTSRSDGQFMDQHMRDQWPSVTSPRSAHSSRIGRRKSQIVSGRSIMSMTDFSVMGVPS